jgi:hypothetical protein
MKLKLFLTQHFFLEISLSNIPSVVAPAAYYQVQPVKAEPQCYAASVWGNMSAAKLKHIFSYEIVQINI